MPKDNIERAVKRSEMGDAANYEEIRYEGFGPGGVGLIVEVLTDNRNRAASAVRSLFTKHGGSLGETGSVSFLWDRVGQIVYPAEAGSEEAVMEAAIEAGAEDVESDLEKPDVYERARSHPLHRLRRPGRRGRRPHSGGSANPFAGLVLNPRVPSRSARGAGTLLKLRA